MTYLVTGAAGFIGAALAKRLLDEGHQVVTIDNLSTGIKENIPAGCVFIEGNTYDPQIIAELNNFKFDAIFHMAGQSGGVTCWDDPLYDMNSNVTATLMLLDYAKNFGCKTFVYASSMSVYGDENPCPVREGDEIKPKTFYAVGKIASEHYMRIYSNEYGIKCTALRFNNVYGPGQNMKNLRQGMVSIYLAYAIKDKIIPVMGAKDRYRDFVYIDDTVEACILAAKGQEKELFNVYTTATNRKTTCEQLIKIMKTELPFEITAEYRGSTKGDQFGIFCSYEKIYNALGWEPKVKLEEGIHKMVEWALANVK